MARYKVKDPYFIKAKKEGYRARSVYKLQEIDKKFHLFKKDMTVLDLGAHPGSWTEYTAPKVKEVVAIDLKPLKSIEAQNVTLIESDALNYDIIGKFDVILNDMSPSTSGIKHRDQIGFINLNQGVLSLAKKLLKRDGVVVSKIFMGVGFDEFIKRLKSEVSFLKTLRVKATRKGSKERYLVYKLKKDS